jgi:hypothetical protein
VEGLAEELEGSRGTCAAVARSLAAGLGTSPCGGPDLGRGEREEGGRGYLHGGDGVEVGAGGGGAADVAGLLVEAEAGRVNADPGRSQTDGSGGRERVWWLTQGEKEIKSGGRERGRGSWRGGREGEERQHLRSKERK